MAEAPSDCPDPAETPRRGQHAARGAAPVDFHFSLFTPIAGNAADDSVLTDALDTALRETTGRWTVHGGGVWCTVSPDGATPRPQGWKLHVSATPASAPEVLSRALPVLLASSAAFKFASTLDHVAMLNDRNTSRGHSGKFLTVYPADDDEAVRIAADLHEATTGLAGPRVLSDRPYVPGSLVHYRYGAFVEQRQFSHDGFYAWTISDPDGNPVEDRRVGQYSPPSWVDCPFPSARPTPSPRQRGDGVLIGGRFRAREAIRHTNRGGVYRATDTHTGAMVIVKEARPHVGADRRGRDERDRLRAEAGALRTIAPLGLAPHVVSVFEQHQHLFLAEDLVPGVPLRQWVPDQIRAGGWRRRVPGALAIARRVVALLESAHRTGMVVRDFNPNNIMVSPDGELRLIDLELAVLSGDRERAPRNVGTPGFSSPEQMAGASPDERADLYSLGATLCFLFVGTAPGVTEHDDRPRERCLAEWLDARWDGPDALRVLILGLMSDDPDHRPTPAQANTVLSGVSFGGAETIQHRPSAWDDRSWQRAVDGIVGFLLDEMAPDSERLWPVSCAHGSPDPCNVQHGAAGVLGALTECLRLRASRDPRLESAVATIADWIVRRLHTGDGRPPGLYFGEAGIAWALLEAGEQLGSDRIRTEGLKLAADLPDAAANPDITHGTAGIGIALAHLWHRTGDPELLRKVERSADALAAEARTEADGLSWSTPAEVRSQLAGRRYFGFAHGTAGVAYFLLAAACATGREDHLLLATRAGDTLLDHAISDGDLTLWGAGTGDEATAPHWCHGSSGIGTFLARLYRVTGEQRFRAAAEGSARAVTQSAVRGVLAQCHGLSGNGDFLLDMGEATADPSYQRLAADMAVLVDSSRTHQDGRVVFPDEHGGLTCTWGDGMTGVLAFLLRLRFGTPRMWMADEVLGGDAG